MISKYQMKSRLHKHVMMVWMMGGKSWSLQSLVLRNIAALEVWDPFPHISLISFHLEENKKGEGKNVMSMCFNSLLCLPSKQIYNPIPHFIDIHSPLYHSIIHPLLRYMSLSSYTHLAYFTFSLLMCLACNLSGVLILPFVDVQ